MYNLVTFGGQHMGVSDIPGCFGTNLTLCRLMDEILADGCVARLRHGLLTARKQRVRGRRPRLQRAGAVLPQPARLQRWHFLPFRQAFISI